MIFLIMLMLLALLPFIMHEQSSFVDPSSATMPRKRYRKASLANARLPHELKYSNILDEAVKHVVEQKKRNRIEPRDRDAKKDKLDARSLRNHSRHSPPKAQQVPSHSVKKPKRTETNTRGHMIYNITAFKNPETLKCPYQLTSLAPKWKNKNCRGDINMIWSVATYTANNGIFSESIVHNPRQTAADVHRKSMPALFIADPFLIPRAPLNSVNISDRTATWYMFSEILDATEQKGKIGLHISHNNMLSFKFKKIVIEEPWHLSFPYIVKENGKYYMTTSGTSGIRSKPYFLWLYEAVAFPHNWKKSFRILDGQTESAPVDPALVKHNSKWYLFIRDVNIGDTGLERLFVSDRLVSKFREHPKSKRYNIRQSGRIVFDPDRVVPGWVVFNHTDKRVYGIPIEKLSEDDFEYNLTESKLILSPLPKTKWASAGMHTLSMVRVGKKKWVGLVDGWTDDRHLATMGCLGRDQPAWKCQKKSKYYLKKFPGDIRAKVPNEPTQALHAEFATNE